MKLLWGFSEFQNLTSLVLFISHLTISKVHTTNTLCNCNFHGHYPDQYPASLLLTHLHANRENKTPRDLYSADKLITLPAIQQFKFYFLSPSRWQTRLGYLVLTGQREQWPFANTVRDRETLSFDSFVIVFKTIFRFRTKRQESNFPHSKSNRILKPKQSGQNK